MLLFVWTVRLLLLFAGLSIVALMISFGRRQGRAGELRGARLGWRWAFVALLISLSALALPEVALFVVAGMALMIVATSIAWIMRFSRARNKRIAAIPLRRHDERDNVFARNQYKPGTPPFEDYYARHPERLATDDKFRALPGLFGLDASFYQPYLFATGRAMLDAIYRGLYNYMEPPIIERDLHPDPASMTRYLKEVARSMGAHSVGVVALRDYHLFTHAGYGRKYGEVVETNHRYALVFTVEMDREITATAPRGSVWLEIGKHYLGAATISTVLSGTLRQLGYDSRPHLLERDQVVMPLVARDAGLGEIGRIGVLMTPSAGPRVRIGVVTTELQLEPDLPKPDFGMLDFCTRCTKCADACPANAIPFDGMGDDDGVQRWSINHEACFSYWGKTGVPCGRCLAVCPFSGENTGVDWLIKQAARSTPLLQATALAAHDHLYGKKPKPLAPPEWTNVKQLPKC